MIEQNSFKYLWPTLIGTFNNPNHSEIKEKLIRYFEEYKKNNPSSRRSGENYKLYESNYDLHLKKNKTIDDLLKNFMALNFIATAKEANKDYLNLIGDSNLAVTFTDAWFIHYEKGGFVIPHEHGQCSWCCVYFVKIGKDATPRNGGTYFQKPTPNRNTLDFGSYYNTFLSVEAEPLEGKMYIWPSYIMHGSYPYEGNEDKIIISANATISIMKDGKQLRSI